MAALPVALITGTNSGVGLALAVKLAANHRVFAGMRGVTEAKRADLDAATTAANVQENVTVLELDVCSDASVQSAVESMLEQTEGRCDILVNNAGYSVVGSVEMVSMEDATAQFDTNFFGVIRCQKAVLPAMRQQKSGKIINVSSVGGVWGQPFNDVYCASKFALEGMSESQAALFRTFGVRVTCVQPGAIKTAFVTNLKRPDFETMPVDYQAPLQSTMAAYQSSFGVGQTPEELSLIHISEPTRPY
eukprot:TRINITY_DN15612_c0_g1_i1.p1 TRINITY_DN15612_c0_g1~~TRINITY_DN15612_c0_g1_i1.p1  ORF type:complete len:247 (-),score=60.16 TRINITY_DN15612_c0_g1_i1:52-792(-)